MEIIQDEERLYTLVRNELAELNLTGTVAEVAVDVVVRVVVRRVLHLVEDDAGGGDAGSLQEADTVDQEGAEHLSHQRSRLIILLFVHHER